MPYRVIVGRVAIECDSADEALEIVKRAGGDVEIAPAGSGERPANIGSSSGSSRWTDVRVADFFRKIKEQQRKVIDILLEYPDGRTDQQLLQLLGMKSGKELAGVMTGLVKNAKSVGADPKDLYTRRAVTLGDERRHEYVVSDSFRKVAVRARGKA